MTRPLLPPDYVKVEIDWLYGNHEIKEPAKIFYMQLRGLAWGRESTPWLKMDEIEELTGKKHSVIWGYMSTLRTYRRLSWRTSGDGSFMYTFTEVTPKVRSYSESSEFPSTTTLINKDNDSVLSKEEEPTPKVRSSPKVRSRVPSSPKEAVEHPDIRVFTLASGRIPASAQYKTVVESIALLRNKHGVTDSALADLIKPYWLAWSERKRKDGKAYNPAAVTWLTEWAMNEHVPPAEKGGAGTELASERNNILQRMAKNVKRI